jgi:Zn-dependent M28 family amino/carboxypeptidase
MAMSLHPSTTGRRRVAVRTLVVGAVAVFAAALAPVDVGGADAAPARSGGGGGGGRSCERQVNNTYESLLRCVSARGVTEHLQAFQGIADANGGTRASGTPGYDASADYVAGLLEGAGYAVTRQPFDFPFFEELSPAVLEQTAPTPTVYETGTFEFAGTGDVTGTVTPVDVNLTGDRASTSGCEPEDFAGTDWSGSADIALTQRGSCDFAVKALNAQTAGAEAVIIFNQGNDPGRMELLDGTLGDQSAGVITIPVVGASFDDGAALAQAGVSAHVATETFWEVRSTENVLAESRRGRADNVVMAGAHLDSVTAGPGINDNGTGSAALLEIALAMAKVRPPNKLRFAWWGAEESGLVGSTNYVEGLSEEQAANIALYMNFDMIGSPNFVHTIYDADESTFTAADFGVVVPEGSTAIEDLYESFYTSKRVPYDDTAFTGRSDYEAFILADIPAAGLFTGAEEAKTAEQQAIWGGTTGEAFDPCYHDVCDTIDDVNQQALGINSDAIAFAMLTFGYSTRTVNGEPGHRVPGRPYPLPAPAGPEGTFVTGGGAGPSHSGR